MFSPSLVICVLFFLNNVYNRVEKNNESRLNALDNQDDYANLLKVESLLSRCTEDCHSNLFMEAHHHDNGLECPESKRDILLCHLVDVGAFYL